jgi:YVTN family beta-propeller protein
VGRRSVLMNGALVGLGALAAVACGGAGGPSPTAPAAPSAAPSPTPVPTTPRLTAGQAVPPTAAGAAPTPTAPSATTAAAGPPSLASPSAETVYVFNVASRDVTVIDAASRRVVQTRPLGASVRWLSPDVTYWDGQRVWTYDHPADKVQAIAIDLRAAAVTNTIKDIGTGPAHSLAVLADKRKAAINVAGDDAIAFLDLPSGQIEAKLKTGAFP